MINLRAADRCDCYSLAQLRAASLVEQELLAARDVPAFVAPATREFSALFEADRVCAWIACDAHRVVASSCAVFYDRLPYPDGSRHAELCGVYVMPAYRKRGFASELVREVVAGAHAGGARKTFLRPSRSAKSLYARLGFVDTEYMSFEPRAECVLPMNRPCGVVEPRSGYACTHDDGDHPREHYPAGGAEPSVHQRFVRL